MIGVLESFEQQAGRFPPLLLLAPGLALVALGLIAWLAGIGVRRLVLALVGMAIGAITGWLLRGPNPAVVVPAVLGGAVLMAIWPRLSTAILLAALAIIVAFVITTKIPLGGEQKTFAGRAQVGPGQEQLTVPESLQTMRILAFDVVGRVKAAAADLEPVSLAVIVAPGLVLLFSGLLFARLAGALTFSTLGTLLIFAGLVVLVIHKGSAPIALIQKQGAFYELVLLGMVAFGTLEQFVLCPSLKRRKGKSKEPEARHEGSEHGWRGH